MDGLLTKEQRHYRRHKDDPAWRAKQSARQRAWYKKRMAIDPTWRAAQHAYRAAKRTPRTFDNWAHRSWLALKSKAKKRNIPFDIDEADIYPGETCPVFGTPFVLRHPRLAPSVDRVKPELGYVKGNVAVISRRANTMKQDATLGELRALVAWLARQEN